MQQPNACYLKSVIPHFYKKPRFFCEDYSALSPDGAERIVSRGIWLIGLDYLSIAPNKESGVTHRILLKAGNVIVEGLERHGVAADDYGMYCLPLHLVGSDAAPARAILGEGMKY